VLKQIVYLLTKHLVAIWIEMACTGIAVDNDTYELSNEGFTTLKPMGRPKASIHKKPISIRLTAEVFDYFKDTGKGR